MKTKSIILVLALVLFAIVACKNKTEKKEITTEIVNNPVTANGDYDTSELPKFEFPERNHDFGVLIQGEKVSYTFKYKNVGGADLILRSAKGSCGCTVPKWSREPLAPGKEGEIEIIFDSSHKKGKQVKTITLLANTQPNKEVLTITGEVVISNK
ncbi:MAG: DUF1573 domain-containing protein [Chlorobi bacterium]|nr:DUF1573 domain-containing protein [Chlorobiota bacterium]